MVCPLLVALDDPDALAAALRSGADALVLDLGDAEATGDRAALRRAALDVSWRAASRRLRVIVRVAPVASGLADDDLDAIMVGAPDAVLLPGTVGRTDVQHLAAKLAVREAECGISAGRTGIVAVPADTAAGVLALGTLPGATDRLWALAWEPAALAGALGVDFGASPVRAARDLLVVAAAACGMPAIDLAPAGDRPSEACGAARRDGFGGRLAFRPAEVALVREAFRHRP